jgi:hypothetical protein
MASSSEDYTAVVVAADIQNTQTANDAFGSNDVANTVDDTGAAHYSGRMGVEALRSR